MKNKVFLTAMLTFTVTSVIWLFVFMLFNSSFSDKVSSLKIERGIYCQSINRNIGKIDFKNGKVENNTIYLYDFKGELMHSQEFVSSQRDLLYFYKDSKGNNFYVFSRSLDDESGVVCFDSQCTLDGIGSLERLGGNCFYYDSYCDLYNCS